MVNRFIFKFHSAVALKISLVLISLGLFLLLNSCGKNEEFRFDTSYNKATSLDFLMAEYNYRSIFLLLYKLSTDTATLNNGSGFIDSAYVTGKGNNWIFTFDENKKVPDGSTRSGQIVVEWTAPLVDSGAVANVSFKNYTVNQKDITGSLIIRQLAYPALKYKVEMTQVSLQKIAPSNRWLDTLVRISFAGTLVLQQPTTGGMIFSGYTARPREEVRNMIDSVFRQSIRFNGDLVAAIYRVVWDSWKCRILRLIR